MELKPTWQLNDTNWRTDTLEMPRKMIDWIDWVTNRDLFFWGLRGLSIYKADWQDNQVTRNTKSPIHSENWLARRFENLRDKKINQLGEQCH